ncbi:hypothetical protein H8356DRAFT_1691976 [Neocallimastix lanati (nom. inval.)]|jgi:hypothetical protein|uniref:Uncharacterized protein n=1 Tax=Neocallimastix californiae TaxID=1754190 RepID=A0A1Y2DGQ0_9FUNG|nr:hypothetical protein H8356DRAFT_1691976 [Neocallimastix sp. JGI-2020a]ORY58296.1 hypothetical protein LY90DRAFT_701561 [Neocallimastix californiae]|eukprot:ORY58296.1 hypothetical protein LY90DRAFT_701561 [Neocallimastix californiae]
MKLNNILKGLFVTLIGSSVNAAAISGTGTVTNVKYLSAKCFAKGGFEFHYDSTTGSNGIVCIKRTPDESSIIQSTNDDCPIGSLEDYSIIVKCYNSLLHWNKVFYDASNDAVQEYEAVIPKTENFKSTKTVPVEQEKTGNNVVVGDKNEACSTKVVNLINTSSEDCFRFGGNIYYHNNKPRVCSVPNEVCIKKVEKYYEIIDSNYMNCQIGDKGTKLGNSKIKKCMKSIKKWNKIYDTDKENVKENKEEEIIDDEDEE